MCRLLLLFMQINKTTAVGDGYHIVALDRLWYNLSNISRGVFMKGLKTLTAVLLSAVLFLSGFPIYAMGSGLDLPIIEDGGTTYYNVTSKADLKTAVLYCLDNFMDQLPICFDEDKRDWDDAYGSNVVNFLDYYTKGFFTYRQYSVNTVIAYGNSANQEQVLGALELSYIDTPDELKKADDKIESIVSGISSKSTYDKLLYIAEYVCQQTEYGFKQLPDGGYDAINGVYDVLSGIRTNTVCTSYALTFQRFMEKAGINSYILANGGVHAWNIIELDGKWYGVDCTFGDLGNSFDRKYFLMGKNEMQMYNTPGANIDPVAVFAKNHKVSDQNYSASSNPPKPTESRVTSKPSETLPTESNVTSNPSDTPSESEINSSAGSSYTEKMPTDIVMVDIVQEPIINRTVFEQAKQAGLDLKLNGDTYSWTFSKETLAEITDFPESFDAGILLNNALAGEDQQKLKSMAGELPYFGFRFVYHGALPGKAKITLSLGKEFAGKTVTVYSVSDSGKPTAEANTTVGMDGTLNFDTDHCSLWFVSDKDMSAETESGGMSVWVWFIVISAIVMVVAIGGFCWWYFICRKQRGQKPTQIP